MNNRRIFGSNLASGLFKKVDSFINEDGEEIIIYTVSYINGVTFITGRPMNWETGWVLLKTGAVVREFALSDKEYKKIDKILKKLEKKKK